MTDCTHAWDIATATAPTSLGTCQNCGETKQFDNATPYNPHQPGPKTKAQREAQVQVSEGRRDWDWGQVIGRWEN